MMGGEYSTLEVMVTGYASGQPPIGETHLGTEKQDYGILRKTEDRM